MAAMRSVIQNVRGALAREARALTGADVVVQSRRPWDAATRATIDDGRSPRRRRRSAPRSSRRRRWCGRRPMATAAARMVELLAVEAAYPFYGRVVLEDGRPYAHAHAARSRRARAAGAARRSSSLNDRRRHRHRQRDVRDSRRDGRRAGPPHRHVLARPARADRCRRSRAHRADRLRQPRALPAAAARARRARRDRSSGRCAIAFRNSFVSVRSYRDTEERVGRELQTAENYLGLVGYVIVVLGGIGVWSVTRVFIQQKMRTIAVLKCVGATAGRMLARLRRAGAAARRRRQRARPRARGARDALVPAAARSPRSADVARPDALGEPAGARHRRAGVAAVRARAAARNAPRQAAAAAARGDVGARLSGRRAPWWRDWRRGCASVDWTRVSSAVARGGRARRCSRAGRRRRGGWAHRLGRLRQRRDRAARRPARVWSGRCGRSAACSGSRCVTRSTASAGPATRPG